MLFLLFLGYMQRDKALKGHNDFNQLYTGAALAGTPDLYSRSANLAYINSLHGFTFETVVYTRPPFYAALLKPLAMFPYLTAYAIFSVATLASILWFVATFSKSCPALPFFAAFSVPFLASLCGGQDTPFLLLAVGASILLTRRSRDFEAGLVLSLGAIKFHLFLFIPVMLVLQKRWTILVGGICGTALLTTFGMVVSGPARILEYVNVLRDPWINPTATIMPNIHGLVANLGGGIGLEVGLVVAVCLMFLLLVLKTDNYELLLAVSLVCSLLVSYHSAIFDDVLLFPVFVLVLSASNSIPLRALSAVILTPLVYFMTLSGTVYAAILPASLLLLLGLAVAEVYGHSRQRSSASERLT